MRTRFQAKKTKIRRANRDDQIAECHDLWKKGSKDLLLEIFIRRSAARSSTVCRLWHSLIHRNLEFIPRFKSQHRQHQDRYPPMSPYAIIFRKGALAEEFSPGPRYFMPSFQLFSDDWMFLHGMLSEKQRRTMSNCLDFVPAALLVIRASCNDLLLGCRGTCWTDDHYVCNPISKRFVQLPPIPTHGVPSPKLREAVGYALVCMPPSPTGNIPFKVVVFVPPEYPLPQEHILALPFTVTVFCSESRIWERKHYHYPQPWTMCYTFTLVTVTCNGVLYWLEHGRASDRVVYLDLLAEQCGGIDFPPSDNDDSGHVMGVVRVLGGEFELRLIRVSNMMSMKADVHLKVWRLDNYNNWVLVHSAVRLERPKRFSTEQPFVGTYVHPTNGDSVFIVWGQYAVVYDLINATYVNIHNTQKTVDAADMLTAFPVVFSYDASKLDNAEF